MRSEEYQTTSAPAKLRQARYASLTCNAPRYLEGTWGDTRGFYSNFRRTSEKGGGLHNFAELKPGTTRATKNVLRNHAIVADIDHGDSEKLKRSMVLLKSAGVSSLLSSTFNHQPAAPRARCVILPSRPVRPSEFSTVWSAVNDRFQLGADEKSKDPAHLFYDPIAPPGAKTLFWSQAGVPLDVDEILARPPVEIVLPTAKTGAEWFDELEQIPDGERDSTLASLAGRLFRSDLQPELAYSLLCAVNEARCKPPLDSAQVVKIANSIAKRERARRGGQ
jgi:hypothetical protein